MTSAQPPGRPDHTRGGALRRTPEHVAWLEEQQRRQLDFGRRFPHPDGGAAWLDARGEPDLARPVHTWVTARMAHVHGLGALLGHPGSRELATTALAGLTGRLHDDAHGGWVASLGPGSEADASKQAYTHAFVVLAASTGHVAAVDGATALLQEALDVLATRFADGGTGLYVDRWDPTWSTVSPYRGVNAHMHLVEAFLAAAGATGDRAHLDRALTLTTRVVDEWAAGNDWRVPEHFDAEWHALPEHHAEQPDHPFEPYGATVGHGLEWARLVVELRAALGERAPDWMLPAARSLFDRAVEDGWAADGADGFVYTTDWEGRPVVRQRMHWVLAEAICAAAALHEATGEAAYDDRYAAWWAHARAHVVDPDDGSWQHELDPELRPAETVWSGRPDLYHSLHAVLLPRLPLGTSAARAVEGGLRA